MLFYLSSSYWHTQKDKGQLIKLCLVLKYLITYFQKKVNIAGNEVKQGNKTVLQHLKNK